MSQFVYALEDKNTHLLKIGISIDPEFRAAQVSKDFGCDAVVVGVLKVEDARRTEQFLHGMLAERRVVGEWFEVPEHQKSYLLAYFSDKPLPRPKTATIPNRPTLVIGPQVTRQPMTGMNDQVRSAALKAMKERKLTQKNLAAQIDMEPPNLSKLLKGHVGKVPDNWQDILDALDLVLVAVPRSQAEGLTQGHVLDSLGLELIAVPKEVPSSQS